ncbi:MFS transporter [Paenibacillus sepulcri]|uniref:MFS transporter n=1 Tax=Paenibacillus sepulcri TaxID=359917 RepID=A0ABS7BZV3_9BACL|nr:MFS transporter [Paenibacillus sepulcri]
MKQQWKKTFALIFSGQLFSILTTSMVQFSIIWHLTATTESAIVLMIAGLAGFLPQVILGPFIGVWLDRWNRKKTMIAADGTIALFSLALGIYYYVGDPSLVFVYVILLIRSTASSFHAPAFQAAIPLMAPEDQLTRVAGWQQMIQSVSMIAGPVLGIAVYSATSLGIVLFLDVFGALIANLMLLLTKIHQPKAEATPSAPSFYSEFKLGWQAFIQAKPIVLLTIGTAIFGIAFMPLPTLFPLMTLSHFGRGGYNASMVEALFGIGMILGAILLSMLGSRLKDIAYICISLVGIGLTCVAIGVISQESFILFVILSSVMGMAAPFFNGPYMAMLQRAYEPAILGRVISLVTSVTLLSAPIGLALAGPIVNKFGMQTWFFWSGIATILTGFFMYVQFKRMHASERLDSLGSVNQSL